MLYVMSVVFWSYRNRLIVLESTPLSKSSAVAWLQTVRGQIETNQAYKDSGFRGNFLMELRVVTTKNEKPVLVYDSDKIKHADKVQILTLWEAEIPRYLRLLSKKLIE